MASRFIFPLVGTGTGGDPFLDLHREMNRLFEDASRSTGRGREAAGGQLMSGPTMDIHETEAGLEITAELPGVSQADVDLRIEGDALTIQGEKRNEGRDKHAHVVERSYGAFQRSVQLPFSPDPEQVEANFDNGILTIVIPKKGKQEKLIASRYALLGRRTSRAVSRSSQKRSKKSQDQAPRSSCSSLFTLEVRSGRLMALI